MKPRAWWIAALCLLAAGMISYGWGELYRRRDHRETLLAMRAPLLSAEAVLDHRDDIHEYHAVTLVDDRGFSVSASLKTPVGGARRHPALVILGGLRTGRRTVEYLGRTSGLILLCLDYPYEGKRENLSKREFILALPKIRRAVLETVPAVMLGVDYLLSRDDVDPDRVVLVGGSLGALFVPAAAALDGRIAAAAALFGAADIERLAKANLKGPALLRAPAAWACAVLSAPVEPMKYAADVSPRPLFLLNSTGDPRVPLACSRLLQETAREPKTVRWIDAGHLSVRDGEFHSLIGNALLDWLRSTRLDGEASLESP